MKSLELKLYLYSFLSDFMIIYSLFALFIEKNGLTTFQISSLFLVWSLTALICEIPSGVWADTYSRKKLLALAEIIRSVGWIIWLIWPTYIGFLIGFIFWGLKNATVSGTFQALAYDELKRTNDESRYLKIMGFSNSLSLVAIVCGTLLASQLISFGYPLILITSIITGFVAALTIYSVPSVHQIKKIEQNYFKVFQNSLKVLKHNSQIRIILIVGFVGAFFAGLGNYAALYFKDAGMSESVISIIYAILALTMAFFSMMAYKFKKVSLSTIVSLLYICGLGLVLSGYFLNYIGVITYIVYASVTRLFWVLLDAKLQDSIDASERATITSFMGFLGQSSLVLMYLSFGLVSALISRTDTFALYGGLMIFLSICFLLYFYFQRKRIAK